MLTDATDATGTKLVGETWQRSTLVNLDHCTLQDLSHVGLILYDLSTQIGSRLYVTSNTKGQIRRQRIR